MRKLILSPPLNFVQCGRLLETCTHRIHHQALAEQLTQKSGKDGLKFLRQALYTGLWPEQITHQQRISKALKTEKHCCIFVKLYQHHYGDFQKQNNKVIPKCE